MKSMSTIAGVLTFFAVFGAKSAEAQHGYHRVHHHHDHYSQLAPSGSYANPMYPVGQPGIPYPNPNQGIPYPSQPNYYPGSQYGYNPAAPYNYPVGNYNGLRDAAAYHQDYVAPHAQWHPGHYLFHN